MTSVYHVCFLLSFVSFVSPQAYSSPKEDPALSAEEKKLILGGSVSKEPVTSIPWRLILSKAPVWALIISHFCHNWGTFILLTWMPTYYNQVLLVSFLLNTCQLSWLHSLHTGIVDRIFSQSMYSGVCDNFFKNGHELLMNITIFTWTQKLEPKACYFISFLHAEYLPKAKRNSFFSMVVVAVNLLRANHYHTSSLCYLIEDSIMLQNKMHEELYWNETYQKCQVY